MSGKFGKCRLCPDGAPEKRLYGSGVCAYHLQNAQDDLSKQVLPVEPKPDLVREKMLRTFYQEQWKLMPRKCENCNARLIANTLSKAKFFICHIIPKGTFESVMVHPSNRWFGCWQCHNDYDSKWTKAVTMPVWPLVVERFTDFMNLISDTELRRLPDALRILIEQNPPK